MLNKKKKVTLLLPDAVPILESKACISPSSLISLHEVTNMEIENKLSILTQTPDPVQVPSMAVPNDAAEQTPRTGRPRVVEPCSMQPAPAAPLLRSAQRPRGSALPCKPIKVTSGPSLKVQGKISLGSDFNPVITDIKSEADLIKQEDEGPQSDDTLSLADDADQPSDADQPGEDLISLSNAQLPLSNAPDPLSDVKVEELEIGVDEVEVTRWKDVTRPVKETRPVQLTKAVELIMPVEDSRSVEESRPVELTSSVEDTRADEEPTVPLPLNLKHELSRAGNDCYNLIRIQANQINKLSVRCGKQRMKLHSYVQVVRRRDNRISYLRAEVEALRSFIEECGWEARSSGGGKTDARRIQIRSSNTVVGQQKPNRQLLIVKRDYKPPKSSVSAQHTSDAQTSTVGAKRAADILLHSSVDSLHTTDNRRKSSVGVKCTIDIQQEKSSVSIPATSDILQKSSVGVKRTSDMLQRSSSGISATWDMFRNSTVCVQRPLDTRQKSSVGIPDTSDVLQKSTDGVKRPLNIQEKSSVSIPGTSDGLPNSTVGVKRILDIRQKLSSDIPSTSNVLQKSTDGFKRISAIKKNPSIAVQPVSVVPQTSVGFQRTSDVRQNALVIQIDGMHNTVLQPKLVRLDDNSMETG